MIEFKGYTVRESVRRCIDLLEKYEDGNALGYQVENQLDIVERLLRGLDVHLWNDSSFDIETKRTTLIRVLNGAMQYIDVGDLEGARQRFAKRN